MKGIIIAGGTSIRREKLQEIIPYYDVLVAADSGLKHLSAIGKHPDYLVGDFDSIDMSLLNGLDTNITRVIRHPVEKDKTDTELSIDVLFELKADEILVLGGTGSRLDHTMSNIFSLRYMHSLGIRGTIMDEHNTVTYLVEGGQVNITNKDCYISILPITADGAEISLIGFRYPLDHECLKFGSSLGISNYLEKNEGSVICHKGEVILIKAID